MAWPWSSPLDAIRFVEEIEARIYRLVFDAIRDVLKAIRDAILGGGGAPDMSAWPITITVTWAQVVDTQIIPGLADAITELDVPADALDLARQHLATVHDRLRDWPADAFDEIRATLDEGLAAGDNATQLRERVGSALDINALTREAEAELERLYGRIEDGVPPDVERQLRDQIRDLNTTRDRDRRRWEWRADRIARTETAGAINAGIAAYGDYQSTRGIVLWRQWWSSLDPRVRPSHRYAHGQVAGPGENFDVGGASLAWPGDPFGPASEVINCRCSLLLLEPDEAIREELRYLDYVATLDKEGVNA